jgi:hypothetical protein
MKIPKNLPRDPAQRAFQIVALATGQTALPPEQPDTRNPAAVALGKLGAAKGGIARAESLTKKERVKAAKKAATARWVKVKKIR